MTSWPWSVLGIEATDDKGAIRKAYATKLKTLDIDNEINAYADLRAARDHALANAGYNLAADDAGDDDWFDGDFDGDGRVTSSDILFAMQSGAYVDPGNI